jgi:hypothetical protein
MDGIQEELPHLGWNLHAILRQHLVDVVRRRCRRLAHHLSDTRFRDGDTPPSAFRGHGPLISHFIQRHTCIPRSLADEGANTSLLRNKPHKSLHPCGDHEHCKESDHNPTAPSPSSAKLANTRSAPPSRIMPSCGRTRIGAQLPSLPGDPLSAGIHSPDYDTREPILDANARSGASPLTASTRRLGASPDSAVARVVVE